MILLCYIPNVGKLNIVLIQDFYQYVDRDIYLIRDILNNFVGMDITKIILLYTPSHVDIPGQQWRGIEKESLKYISHYFELGHYSRLLK